MNSLIGAVGGWVGRQGLASVIGADLGFAVGSALFSYLFAKSPSYESGKLKDLKFSGSSFGAPWPRVWGAGKVGGNIIWMATDANGNHLRQEEARVGPKTARSSVYKTFVTLAVGFCQGALWLPDETNPNGGTYVYRNHRIRRMWANDVLIYEEVVAGTVTLNKHGAVVYGGSATQAADPTMSAWGGGSNPIPGDREIVKAVIDDMDCSDYGNSVPTFRAEIVTDDVNADDVVSDICRLVGLTEDEIDVTAISGIVIRGGGTEGGLVWDSRDAATTPLEALFVAYDFTVVDVDGLLRFVPRGGGDTFTVDKDWLIANPTKITTTYLNRTDLPGRVSVEYYDVDSLFQAAVRESVRVAHQVENDVTISFPLGLTGEKAKTIAARELDRRWRQDKSISINLPMKYLGMAPCDVIENLEIRQGVTVDIEVGSVRINPFSTLTVQGVIRDTTSTDQRVSGGSGNGTSNPLPPVPSAFYPFSAKEILDSHQPSAGFYVVASGDVGWRGAQVWYLPPGASDWLPGPVLSAKAVFGDATSVLSSTGASAGAWDATNTVDVDVSESFGSLETVEPVAVESGANWCWLGDEILGFEEANLTGSYTYTLAELLRGLRGSTFAVHGSGDKFVFASSSSAVARVEVPEGHVGLDYDVKVVSVGQVLSDVTAQTVTISPRTPTATETLSEPSYVTLSANANLTNERVLAVDAGLSLIDGGAGSSATIGLDFTEYEVNLGGSPLTAGHFDITGLTGLTSGRDYIVTQIGGPYTSKPSSDEAEVGVMIACGRATSSTAIRVWWNSAVAISGHIKVKYAPI